MPDFERHLSYCRERIAIAREQVTRLRSGHRCYLDTADVTDFVLKWAEQVIRELTAIIETCGAMHGPRVSAAAGGFAGGP